MTDHWQNLPRFYVVFRQQEQTALGMCVGMVNGNLDETESSQSWDWFQNRISDLGHPSMTQFAETHGFPKSSLSRYFHRERQVPSGTIGPLCSALQVSPQELLSALGAIDWQDPDTRPDQ